MKLTLSPYNYPIHYHYDAQDRLISETDGTTGETMCEYAWLGLTPVASFAANDNTPEDTSATDPATNPDCDEEAITALEASLTQIQATQTLWQNYATFLGNFLAIRQNQITQVEAALETATGFWRFVLLWTQQFLQRSVAVIESESVTAQDAITALEAQAASLSEQITAAQTICDAPIAPPQPPVNDNIAGLTFLHPDHLGRPVFATDADGEIVWDGGITTPFGVQLETLGALTQNLMFPGQYEDLDTEGAGVTLSHNWHRTYDLTLGRYLQSDPIGLAGGLNRYAYVGGNPMNAVDPEGLDAFLHVDPKGAQGHGHTSLYLQDREGKCYKFDQGASGTPNNFKMLLGSSEQGAANLRSINCEEIPRDAYAIVTNEDYDDKIFNCALGEARDHNQGVKRYQVFTNNCTDSAVSVLKCAGITIPNQSFNPRPNSWFKRLKK